MQMPHDLVGWFSLVSSTLGGLWWVLQHTIVSSFSQLKDEISGLREELKESHKKTDDHEVRLTALETWKHDKWEV
ncbi:hypothetical protein [Leuconostoc citreum]|uniref:hypothetical protein n=1 Tax=Leuconostoc citreum TaxID=33964 RepID=UPI0021A51DBB|nr:hypothetical protein [Leuconostoc citreum]MCT3076975.1 hypothetical protein [Leuconostoc citreum]